MSIDINKDKCGGCGACAAVCPGGLIRINAGKARIARPERCWGCASCVKECSAQAIALFLGQDMGGLGGKMTVKKDNSLLHWTIVLPDGSAQTISTDSRDANKY